MIIDSNSKIGNENFKHKFLYVYYLNLFWTKSQSSYRGKKR
jgi:hypothetical protein